jgi:TIR domain
MTSSSPIPRHVFISYAHVDAPFVDRLVEDLERAGIPCWVDRWGLQPGTPDWEQAIREAIADAFAVLLIASPASRQALAVQGEMALASGSRCRVIPLWVGGDRWEDSVALTLIRTQYIDCRGEQYADARSGIAAVLQREWDRLAPQQALLAKAWPPLAGYVSVTLADGRTVAFRAAAYSTVRELLNALYLGYLRDAYRPFSYGREWLLASKLPERQDLYVLAVPWGWLRPAARAQPSSQSERDWDAVPLDTYRLSPGSTWAVLAPPSVALGVATNNVELDETLRAFCRGEAPKELDALAINFLPSIATDRAGRYTRGDVLAQISPADTTPPLGCPYQYVLGGTGRTEALLRAFDGCVLSYQSADSQAPVDWWG